MLRLPNLRDESGRSSGLIEQAGMGLALGFAAFVVVGVLDLDTTGNGVPDRLPEAIAEAADATATDHDPEPDRDPVDLHTAGAVTYGQFADALLVELDAPRTGTNREFLVLWMRAESGATSGVRNNPLNTSWRAPGSETFNSHGVQHYPDIDTGLRATANTIRLDHYTRILQGLRDGGVSPQRLARHLADSPWGTGDLVLRMVRDGVTADPSTVITGTA